MKDARPTKPAQTSFKNTVGEMNINMASVQAAVNRLESLQYSLPINLAEHTELSASELQDVSLTTISM